MGMLAEVRCENAQFGSHRGETHQTKNLHLLGGLLDAYEITPSGRLEFLVYRVENRSDPTLSGIERLAVSRARIFTGRRRDMNYHGWLHLSGFGRAKFTDGTMVAFEPEPSESKNRDGTSCAADSGEWSGIALSDPDRDFHQVGKTFRMSELPGLNELDAFVNEISPAVRSKLTWLLIKHLGLDTNVIRQLLGDESIAEDWLRFERQSE
jgi:hypothetical protein